MMSNYILSIFLFKAGIGALLLTGALSGISDKENPLLSLALIVGLTFSPALPARRLTKILIKTGLRRAYFVSVLSVFGILLALSSLGVTKSFLFYIMYFLLWIWIFCLENLMDYWLYCLKESNNNAGNAQSKSLISIQLGTLSGPFFVALLRLVFPEIEIQELSLAFSIYFLSLFLTIPSTGVYQTEFSWPRTKIFELNQISYWKYSLAIASIWMVIVSFNYFIPLVVLKKLDLSITDLAIYEGIFCVSMALAGMIYSKIESKQLFKYKVLPILVIIATALTLNFDEYTKYTLIIAISIFGLLFGISRINIKVKIGESFNPEEAAMIIATGNALSFVLTMLVISISYIEYTSISVFKDFVAVTFLAVFLFNLYLAVSLETNFEQI